MQLVMAMVGAGMGGGGWYACGRKPGGLGDAAALSECDMIHK